MGRWMMVRVVVRVRQGDRVHDTTEQQKAKNEPDGMN
ncbi:MAG: hypothetical protein OJF50_000251 [Nitrospira sp.]|jgi:hypothetical protein|nr:hypothetical protein [Nitrospira sp.]